MSNRKIFILIVSLFFMWGFMSVIVDSFVPRLKEVFELSFFQAGLVQFAWFIAYGIFGIPSSSLLNRIGYKKSIVLALHICAFGCLIFWPASFYREYSLYLLGFFVVASGISLLQVSANPYITILGKPRLAASRLNLAQAVNSIGTTIAPLFAASFFLSDSILNVEEQSVLSSAELQSYYASEATAVQLPFIFLAMVLTVMALVFYFQKLPIIGQSVKGNYKKVFQNKKLRIGAFLIFLYVGVEVALGSYIVSYGLSLKIDNLIMESPLLGKLSYLGASLSGNNLTEIDPKAIIGALVTLYWGGAMIGRFIGSYLTAQFPPHRILALFAATAAVLVAATISASGITSILFLLSIGLFNSIMFPTIFTLAIDDLGDQKPQGSGILVTAICGGAFIPPAVGGIADAASFPVAFVLPLVCYIIIGALAFRFLGQSMN
ncbi:MAG: glucose/galactose MFS transporter [Saprospirales bacterium]|nr:glucose/galactose MFS transporter [Saprospirales bacterium]